MVDCARQSRLWSSESILSYVWALNARFGRGRSEVEWKNGTVWAVWGLGCGGKDSKGKVWSKTLFEMPSSTCYLHGCLHPMTPTLVVKPKLSTLNPKLLNPKP